MFFCYEQPQSYIVEDTEYTKEGTPVLTANKAFVLGYTLEKEGIYGKGDCIIFDDFTLDCKYVDFPFKVKSSAIKILTAKNKELLRYTFEFLKFLDLSTDEHKRHYIAETQNQELILPTMQIVRTIAHVFCIIITYGSCCKTKRYVRITKAVSASPNVHINIWRSKYCFCKVRFVLMFCSADSLLSIADNNRAYWSCSVYDGQNTLALP